MNGAEGVNEDSGAESNGSSPEFASENSCYIEESSEIAADTCWGTDGPEASTDTGWDSVDTDDLATETGFERFDDFDQDINTGETNQDPVESDQGAKRITEIDSATNNAVPENNLNNSESNTEQPINFENYDLSNIEGLNPGNWENSGFEERMESLQAAENQLAESQNRQPCSVNYFSGATGECGYFQNGEIYINNELVNNDAPYDAVETISHEGRHAYQSDCVLNPDLHPEIDDNTKAEWAENFQNYINPDEDFEAYCNQPIESDAFEYEKKVKKETYG